MILVMQPNEAYVLREYLSQRTLTCRTRTRILLIYYIMTFLILIN